jgi:hypothetical protein
MRLTEFRQRLREAVGDAYADYWADNHVLAELSGRTVTQALADGDDAAMVWRAVFTHLKLPASHR